MIAKKGDTGQGFPNSAGIDEGRRLLGFPRITLLFLPAPALCAGFIPCPGWRPSGPQADRVIMLFGTDYRNPECLFSPLPDGPGDDVRHEIEGDILFDEGVAF